jgi:WD40 repeat protein
MRFFLESIIILIINVVQYECLQYELKYTFNKTNGGHLMAVDVLCLVKVENSTKTYLASGSYDSRIRIFELNENGDFKLKYYFIFENGGHENTVTKLIDIGNGLLASGSDDTTVKIWDLNKGELKYSFTDHRDKILSLVRLDDGLLASGSKDSTINIWDSGFYLQEV